MQPFSCIKSINRRTISNNSIAPYRIVPPAATIAGIALNGVYRTVFRTYNNSHMAARAIALPIKENNISCLWCKSFLVATRIFADG